MKRVMVFGAGRNSKCMFLASNSEYEWVAIADNDVKKQGRFSDELNLCCYHIPIISPNDILQYDWDFVMITPNRSLYIVKELLKLGIKEENIVLYDDPNDFSGFIKRVDQNGDVLVDTGKIKLLWKYEIEKTITYEVFAYHVYKYGGILGDQIVIDVGMNSGIASLYFAQNEAVKAVYSFEPFHRTFIRAMENINLNCDEIKEKIHPFEFGLSNSDKMLSAVWEEDNFAGNRAMETEGKKGIPTNVHVKNAGVFLGGIFRSIPNTISIVLKIDCEGSEYAILESMDGEGVLARCALIIIETHDGRQVEAQNVLTKNGFLWFWQRHSKTLGFLYAVRGVQEAESY